MKKYSHELHLQYIVGRLGQFPPEFLQACEDRNEYFDESGERPSINHDDLGQHLRLGMLLRTNDDFKPTPLEDFLRSLEVVDENDIPGVVGFLRRCLTLDPKLRPNAQELLKDSWLL